MRRILVLTLTIAMVVATFSGCGSDNETLTKHFSHESGIDVETSSKSNSSNEKSPILFSKKDGIVKLTASSRPEGYNYSFSGDDAEVIADHLLGLSLISDFEEDPDSYTGMSWIISVEYENGEDITICHFGNMFIRADGGQWYKMNYEEASRLDTLLFELNK